MGRMFQERSEDRGKRLALGEGGRVGEIDPTSCAVKEVTQTCGRGVKLDPS